MECFGFKLEFGHLVPEFDTDRQKMETRDKKKNGWIKIGSTLLFSKSRHKMLIVFRFKTSQL